MNNAEWAAEVAKFLFTNGNQQRADRLVMRADNRFGGSTNLGGWSESSVARLVEKLANGHPEIAALRTRKKLPTNSAHAQRMMREQQVRINQQYEAAEQLLAAAKCAVQYLRYDYEDAVKLRTAIANYERVRDE